MDTRSRFSIDPRRDYTSIQKKPTHRWTIPQHTTLAYLARSYDNPWKDKTAIFNKYFINELRNPDRLSSGALASMYWDMERGRTGKDAMRLLQSTAFSFVTEPTRVDQDLIEQTATELGIQLIKSLPGPSFKGPKAQMKQRRIKRKAVVLDEDTDFLSENESARRAPKRRQHPGPRPESPHNHLGARTPPLTPSTTMSQQSVPAPKQLPPVAYRAFSSQSQGSYSKEEGFRAGAFLDSCVPLPPDPRSQDYIDETKRHVAPIPTGPTPFISTTTSIVRAVHRALKLGPDAAICVLSLDLADAEGRVQSASALKLQHLVSHYYVPFNELYGKIHPSAILSIMPVSALLASIPSTPLDKDPFKILVLRDSKSLQSGRVALKKANLALSYAVGHAVGKFAQCLGIPYTQHIWEYAILNLVIDFRFGEGLNRRNKWEDLNEVFRNAIERGYQSREADTLRDLRIPGRTRVGRRITEEQASTGGHPEHRGAREIPSDDPSTDEEISIREWMPGIWKYVNIPHCEGGASREVVSKKESINDVNALQGLKITDNADRGPPYRLAPGEQSSRQGEVAQAGSGCASPLDAPRVYDVIDGRYAVRPGRGNTLPIRPPRQLLPNGKSPIRDHGRLDCHEIVQMLQTVPPGDQQGNDQTERVETVYKYSWTGM